MSDIPVGQGGRSATFNLENPLSTRFWSAVKTGTSKDMRDNWCVGYSEKYTVGVWVGNFSGEPMWNVSGITGAAPVWLEVMSYLHKNSREANRPPPVGVIAKKVKFNNFAEEGKKEWFVKGTEPGSSEIREKDFAADVPKIAYPVQGMIIALDPDIPADQQLVFFDTDSGSGPYVWVLNNRPLGKSSDIISWRPETGDYTLSLVGPDNRVVASVDFTVRGD